MQRNDDLLKQFGERVRNLRKQQKLSQEELAFKADLHRTYIGMIERGEKNITLINIAKLAKALDVSLKQLVDATWSQIYHHHRQQEQDNRTP